MKRRTDRTKLKFLIVLWLGTGFVIAGKSLHQKRVQRLNEQQAILESERQERERESLQERMMQVAFAKKHGS